MTPYAGTIRTTLAALALISISAVHAAAPASDADKAFVGKVSQGGMYEVESSKLAIERAMAPDVKDQAITEVHDHELVGAELKKISSAGGVPFAGTLNPMFQQRLDKLKSVTGAEFDAAYIHDMEQIHDMDEKLFAQESVDGSGEFKPFAGRTDRIVKRHIGSLHGADPR
jgi:putative membrane protein